MELIRGIHNLRKRHYGCVLTIGNFDGIHRGHQVLLHRLKQEGLRLGLPTVVMIFEPQPLELFLGDKAPVRLMSLRDKYRYLRLSGIDRLLCVKFDPVFAAGTAEMFISNLLLTQLGIGSLIIGHDFRFGAERKGEYSLLQHAGDKHDFTVLPSAEVCVKGHRVSSTIIRNALQHSDLKLAEQFLGHAYSISGRIAHGNQLGRTLGFPTANVLLKRQTLPIKGVYVVEVEGLASFPLPGVANIGFRPTVGGLHPQLEVHLLNFSQDIYGQYINVIFKAKLRDEQRFASVEELKKQIGKDVFAGYQYFRLTEQYQSKPAKLGG